jgi:triacylglycerol esterase/lipase EstA (alpha/beta hydrolase family)
MDLFVSCFAERDVADFIHRNIRSPPVLLGHSFGGLIIQYYISNLGNNKLKGTLLLF